jgi:predicted NAD-dependent protein-ADP-ribosyltransferase YbiA (DUF1768 family)
MLNLANALATFDDAPSNRLTLSRSCLVLDAARKAVFEWHNDDDGTLRASKIGLNILSHYEFVFRDGHRYNTAMNCFQAQKATDTMKGVYEDCSVVQALSMGQACTIDVSAWGKNRKQLMTEILRTQVEQHPDLACAVRDYGDMYIEDVMFFDPYWSATLPVIWKEIQTFLLKTKNLRSLRSSTK